MDKKPVYAYAWYGLGSRMILMGYTLRIAELLERHVVKVDWRMNWHCRAKFHSLFDSGIESRTLPREPIFVINGETVDVTKLPERTLIVRRNAYVDIISEDASKIAPHIRSLKPVKEINDKVEAFAAESDISNAIGIHVRKTDKINPGKWPGSRQYISSIDDKYMKIIKLLPDHRFFVSADEETEKYVNAFPDRVFYFPKKYVPKTRTPEAIKEALVDMILLSRCRSFLYGIGTFGHCAMFLSKGTAINVITGKNNDYQNPEATTEVPSLDAAPAEKIAEQVAF